jgi:hypothetical protein
LDGRQVDITKEIGRLICISRHYHPDDQLDPDDAKFLHRLGWGLINVAGPEMPEDLIDDMLDEQETSPAFASHLRSRWGELVKRCAEGD